MCDCAPDKHKEANVPRINLMLIESGEIQNYCFVKRESALLFDQTKNSNAKHYSMLCLTGFSRADLLESHKKILQWSEWKADKDRDAERGENTVAFQNHHKQMKVPYLIYADFEALVRKIPGCERGPESKQKSYTEKTEWHEACGFSFTVVRSDGAATQPVVYRGKNAVKTFLNQLLQVETQIREILAAPKPIAMTAEDWEKYKNTTECHICNNSFIKDEFLDSIPVCDHEAGRYCGQITKVVITGGTQKNRICWAKKRKKRKRQNRQWIANNQETCWFCAEPLTKKNF